MLTTSRFPAVLMLGWLLSACGPRAELAATSSLSAPLRVDMITITVRDGGRTWVWHGNSFRSTPNNATPNTPVAQTRTSGQLEFSVQLRDSGAIVGEGTVKLPLRDDWIWSVDLHNATADPRQLCFGCVGSQAFPLSPAYRSPDRDSLWLVWGGNSISHPVIY